MQKLYINKLKFKTIIISSLNNSKKKDLLILIVKLEISIFLIK